MRAASHDELVRAREDADTARMGAEALGGRIEERGRNDHSLAILLAGLAIAAEIRALALLIDHARGGAA